MLISLKVFLIVFFSILNFSSKILIEGMCVVALAPAVMTISGSTFHSLLAMLKKMFIISFGIIDLFPQIKFPCLL